MILLLGFALSVLLVCTSVFLKLHFIAHPLPTEFGIYRAFGIILGCLFSMYAWLSLTSMVVGGFVWIYLMSKAPLSVVYPLASFSYAVMILADFLIFGTPITAMKVFGVCLICAGVLVISR